MNLASLALDKAIDEGEGKVEFDDAAGILLMICEAGQLLEMLGTVFREKCDEIVPILSRIE